MPVTSTSATNNNKKKRQTTKQEKCARARTHTDYRNVILSMIVLLALFFFMQFSLSGYMLAECVELKHEDGLSESNLIWVYLALCGFT